MVDAARSPALISSGSVLAFGRPRFAMLEAILSARIIKYGYRKQCEIQQ